MKRQPETAALLRKNRAQFYGTVAGNALSAAILSGHPLLNALDALLWAAKTHKRKYESRIAEDNCLGPPWLDAAKGVRCLLNGDFGPIDNGTLEELFWIALEAAGFEEKDL